MFIAIEDLLGETSKSIKQITKQILRTDMMRPETTKAKREDVAPNPKKKYIIFTIYALTFIF